MASTSDTMRKRLSAILASSVLAGSVLALGGAALAQAKAEPAATPAKEAETTDDVVVFRNGNRVEGTILEETPTTIRMKVKMGSLSAETTYQKAEILEIKRATAGTPDPKATPKVDPAPAKKPADPKTPAKPAADPSKPAAAATPAAPSIPSTKDAGKKDAKKDEPEIEPGGPKVYVIDMKGEFGRNVSHTPIERIVEDMKKHQPEVLVLRIDHKFTQHGEDRPEFVASADQAYQQGLETARQMQTLIFDTIRDDPEFTVKPRTVAWVRKALGSAAWLPFVAQEIYFTSDGLHGGVGRLEKLLEGMGDEVVREKQYSLRMARAEGLANKGGHDARIIKAMSRTEYVLSVKYDGDQVVLLERAPETADEILLTDDGDKENADLMQDAVRMKGNDTLNLDAALAQRLGFSRGTADTLDDLMYQMGVARNYQVVKGQQDKILKDWGKAVADAESQFRRLFRDYNEVTIKAPGGYKERTAARGQRKRILQQIQALLRKYEEAINPYTIEGYPAGWIQRLDLRIAELEAQQQADKPD